MSRLKGKYADSHWVVKIIQWLSFMLISGMALILLCLLVVPNQVSIEGLKALQACQTIGLLLLPPFAMAYLWSKSPIDFLSLNRCPKWNVMILAVVMIIVAIPGINLISEWNQQLRLPAALESLEQWMMQTEGRAAILTERMLQTSTAGGLLVNLLIMAVLPALAEELTFRGVVQTLVANGLQNKQRIHIAIWTTAILFSAIHFQFYGFVPRMLLGALFGYMLYFTGSMWTPVLMHFINNGAAVLTYFFFGELLDGIGTGTTTWLGVLSIALTLSLLPLIHCCCKKKE